MGSGAACGRRTACVGGGGFSPLGKLSKVSDALPRGCDEECPCGSAITCPSSLFKAVGTEPRVASTALQTIAARCAASSGRRVGPPPVVLQNGDRVAGSRSTHLLPPSLRVITTHGRSVASTKARDVMSPGVLPGSGPVLCGKVWAPATSSIGLTVGFGRFTVATMVREPCSGLFSFVRVCSSVFECPPPLPSVYPSLARSFERVLALAKRLGAAGSSGLSSSRASHASPLRKPLLRRCCSLGVAEGAREVKKAAPASGLVPRLSLL